jgi:hypothetical protein
MQWDILPAVKAIVFEKYGCMPFLIKHRKLERDATVMHLPFSSNVK